jgi:phosphoserine phosphatase RsbU/P
MSFLHPHDDARPEPAIEPVPNVFPKIAGAELAAVLAGQRIAGDFHDSIRVGSERVLFGLLDVAGRRDDNRGILNKAQEIFRNLGAELFAASDINEADAMTELCLRLNRGLIEVASGVHPCPAFIACYHERFGTLCYTNAGHTPGLLRDDTGISELASTGLPLGLFSHSTCESPIIAMPKNSAVLLVSRGVVEAENHGGNSGEDFSLDRVKQSLQSEFSDAQSLCVAVLEAVDMYSEHVPAANDRTALALVRTA